MVVTGRPETQWNKFLAEKNLLWIDTTRHDTTRHDTTRHDTTRHDTTRHDTTRHDTTRHAHNTHNTHSTRTQHPHNTHNTHAHAHAPTHRHLPSCFIASVFLKSCSACSGLGVL